MILNGGGLGKGRFPGLTAQSRSAAESSGSDGTSVSGAGPGFGAARS